MREHSGSFNEAVNSTGKQNIFSPMHPPAPYPMTIQYWHNPSDAAKGRLFRFKS